MAALKGARGLWTTCNSGVCQAPGLHLGRAVSCCPVACVRVCVCVCVNTRALSSRPLTLPVTRLRTEPPLKYSTRHRHGSVWGHLLAALILSSVGTSPRTLLRPSPGAAPEKWCWRPCARGGPGRFPADTRPLPGGITALAVSSLPPRGRRTEALYLQAAI